MSVALYSYTGRCAENVYGGYQWHSRVIQDVALKMCTVDVSGNLGYTGRCAENVYGGCQWHSTVIQDVALKMCTVDVSGTLQLYRMLR